MLTRTARPGGMPLVDAIAPRAEVAPKAPFSANHDRKFLTNCVRSHLFCWSWVLFLLCLARPAAAQYWLPAAHPNQPIQIRAQYGTRWHDGTQQVWLLRENCWIRHGEMVFRAHEAVLWQQQGRYDEATGQITLYLEGQVEVEWNLGQGPQKFQGPSWLGTLDSSAPLDLQVVQEAPAPRGEPELYRRAMAVRNPKRPGTIQRTQFVDQAPLPGNDQVPPAGTRRVRAFPRSTVFPQIQYFPSPSGDESIALITGGVNLLVEGLPDFGAIDIATDRMVLWTRGGPAPDLGGQSLQESDTPLEIYMEGNIVFRQGDRIIEAQRMYYDVQKQIGIVLEADILTPVPEYEGLLRLRAQIVQQTGPNRFVARDAFLTSSRLGVPGYRVAAQTVDYQDQQRPLVDPFTGQPIIDPVTGQQAVEHDKLATSTNNLVFFEEFPIFYWPVLATDLDQPQYYIKRVQLKQDQIFGTQVMVDLDAYQVLGIRNPPMGTDWDFSVDYLSERGFGLGTNFKYDRVADWNGFASPYRGFFDAWAIDDGGIDNLGGDRTALPPEETFRYRLLGQHRQFLPEDYQLTAEFGLISDRNFLEQYYEREWDQLKDQTTGFELKKLQDNRSWSLSADVRLNDFFTQTENLPRLDHFWLGEPLWDGTFTWYEHTQLSYNDYRVADPPNNPADLFAPLPWEVNAEGEKFVTRHEIDYPLDLGVVKLVPYALGEYGHWGDDLFGDDLDRLYGQAGLRASVPLWTVYPEVESSLWNVHGVAHKVVFDADMFLADANHDVTELPLYEPLDDDSQEHFRRRLSFHTFGVPPSALPPQFDPRLYAIRNGLGSWVTSPSAEVADDLTALRMGVRQRWQTKRGPEQARRIIDWIVLDTQAVWFPDDDRDNFGEPIGQAEYDFRWHVGDRTTIISDGFFDFFDQGAKFVSIGAFLNRPPRGSFYVGLQSMEGPFSIQVLTASYSYRMSPKWMSSVSTTVDISGGGNLGQAFTITRIGESLLWSVNFTVDPGKDVTGIGLVVEPRFLPRRMSRIAPGVPIAGAMGLE